MFSRIRLLRQLRDYMYDDSIDINVRLSSFFVNIGIIAAIMGLLIGLAAHVPARGIISIASIAVGAPLVASFTRHAHRPELFGKIVAIGISFLIPLVWITSGGSTGGNTIWFLYELFYIVLFARKGRLLCYLVPAVLLQAGCFLLEMYYPQYVFNFTTPRDIYISQIGGFVTITAEICITVIVQKRLYQRAQEKSSKSEDFTRNFITSIANTLDTKDTYTGGHSRRVAVCASAIAKRMGMTEAEQQNIHTVALLHDIGKIGVPDKVLNKPGRLTEEEFAMIRNHPIYGAEIVKDISMIPHLQEGVLHHHERYDGTGYPDKLKGEDIPLFARIIAVADSYDAMSTNRIYRKFIKREDIIADFIQCRGTQFDPYIADIFVQMLMEGFVVEDASSVTIASAEKNLSGAAANMMHRIEDTNQAGRQVGAMTVDTEEFSQMYAYLRNLGRRYGDNLLLVTIGLKPVVGEFSEEKALQCMSDLSKAIIGNIRSVDICTRYNSTSYMVLLLDAPLSSLDQIMDRIQSSFYKLQGNASVGLTHVVVGEANGNDD